MKLRTLTIHNIASIAEATIDFTSAPLGDSELFLITGETGSGKSTILDAICLALYAGTPRMRNIKSAGKIKDYNKEMSITDTCQLMRRHTDKAFAQLTFRGNDGNEYEAEWSIEKKRTNLTRRWRLTNLTHPEASPDEGNGSGSSKDTQIHNAIQTAIGLDFEQFCRTTMLAQGEFTRFLNSDDKEKAAILEKVTGTEIYSRIGARVFEIMSQHKQEWESANEKTKGVKTLTPEETEEKNRQIQTLENESAEKKTLIQAETDKAGWIEQEQRLNTELQTAEANYKKAQETTESDEHKRKNLIVSLWDATTEPRTWLNEQTRAKQTIANNQLTLKEYQKTFMALLRGKAFLDNETADIGRQLDEVRQQLETEKEKASVYANAQTITAHLNTVINARNEIADRLQTIKSKEELISGSLAPEHQKLTAEAGKARSELQELQDKETAISKELQDMQLPVVRQQRDDSNRLLSNLTIAQERIQTWVEKRERYEADGQEINKRQADIEKLKQQITNHAPKVEQALKTKEEREQTLKKQKETVEDFAKTLRTRLQIGDTCPICGQRVAASIPHEDEWQKLYEEAQEAFDTAQKEYNSLQLQLNQWQAEQKTQQAALATLILNHEKDNSAAEAERKAVEKCRECALPEEILNNPQQLITAIKAIQETEHDRIQSLQTQIKQGEAKENELKTARLNAENKRNELQKKEQEVAAAQEKIDSAQTQIKNAESVIASKNKDIEKSQTEAEKYLSVVPWQTDWRTDTGTFVRELTADAKLYSANVSKSQSLSPLLVNKQMEQGQADDAIEFIRQLMPEWETQTNDVPCHIEKLTEQFNSLRTDIATSAEMLKQAETLVDTDSRKIRSFLESHTGITAEQLYDLNGYSAERIQMLRQTIENENAAVGEKKALYEKARQAVAEHALKRPQLAEDDTLETVRERTALLDRQLQQLMENKVTLCQELKKDEEDKRNLQEYIDDAKRKEADYLRWSRLNTLIGDKDGTKFRRIAQSYILANLTESANAYMQRLTNRYTLHSVPGTLVITVEDAYQGYVSRPTSTISGGESFLVSLALALALSDIGRNLRVETLFIDEGFGTLSGEPLQKAIDTLQSLRKHAGRQVGIISHIEEVRERIPVQIQVSRVSDNSAGTINITG
ncbi:MAG: AAA family ATPase [Paludibacteraceae bacterium]|nr:AAA family ATPase [Paludibacteraceae bacterium]